MKSGWKVVFAAMLLMTTTSVLAQRTTYQVGKFSEDFRATVSVEDNVDGAHSVVSVFDTHTGKRLVRVVAEALPFDLRNGEIPPDVKELPYGEQSVLIHEDFNFDAKPDFAIMDGQNSCYGGPSFQIYLATATGFSHSPAFTRLAQEYCGMFQVDPKARRLHAMTKSGCCWHLYETFEVVGNHPETVESISDEVVLSAPSYRRETVSRGKKTTTKYYLGYGDKDTVTGDEKSEVLSFRLKGHPEKRVVVFVTEGTVDYALVRGERAEVEFSHALDVRRIRAGRELAVVPPFIFDDRQVYDDAARALAFCNGKTMYTVEDDLGNNAGRLGVTIRTAKNEAFIEGDPATRKGSLARLKEKRLYGPSSNVISGSCSDPQRCCK